MKEWGFGESQLERYMLVPVGIAIDKDDNIYVADSQGDDNGIWKFDTEGRLLLKWGSFGSGDGEFDFPGGVAVSPEGDVYVVDCGNDRIQKFTSDGKFINKWGSTGSGDGEFLMLESGRPDWLSQGAITIDELGYVYVQDIHNCRIQKFDSDGQFLLSWPVNCTEPPWRGPTGIDIGADGNLFVADTHGGFVHIYSTDGQFIATWSVRNGNEDGPWGVFIDRNGFIYVTSAGQNHIRKYDRRGTKVDKWGSGDSLPGWFQNPLGIVTDEDGNIHIADSYNSRIQKFTPQGEYISEIILDYSKHDQPDSVTIGQNGDYYLATCCLVHRYDSEGQLIGKWGNHGNIDEMFGNPAGIATDSLGNVYVSDRYNTHTIQKFTAEGAFIKAWGGFGEVDGMFNEPTGIAIDANDVIYVCDSENERVQLFNTNGDFLGIWADTGMGYPNGISVDNQGNIHVTDRNNDKIYIFTPQGTILGKWGDSGTHPGQFSQPGGITLSADGLRVFVTEERYNRVQVFKKQTTSEKSKAIIVAGGGPFAGNHLWGATQMCTNFAYHVLVSQGFTKESIHYLTSDRDLDLDSNGVPDDVDDNANGVNLEAAITKWAADAENVVLYLVDHGGTGTFRINGTETLSVTDLDIWLDQLQISTSCSITIIIDTCESGSFVSQLIPPVGKKRVILTSTSPGESAYFVTQGSVSFSSYFWTHIFNGLDIKNAFTSTVDAIAVTTPYQHPLMDTDGDGVDNAGDDYSLAQGVYIGNGNQIIGDTPQIGYSSPDQTIVDGSTATLFADSVTDDDGIARVWAVIRSPDYVQRDSSNPVQELPSIDLLPVEGDTDRFEIDYDGFNVKGAYTVAIYAMDRIGNTSIPVLTTVSVDNPLRRRAIIVAGGNQANDMWLAIERNAKLAYEALLFQGYKDDSSNNNEDIFFMSSVTFSTGVDYAPSLSNLQSILNGFSDQDTQDVVIYLVGPSDVGSFLITPTELLDGVTLNGWIDALQNRIPGRVTVIYDAPQSGVLTSQMISTSGRPRTIITSCSANQSAVYQAGGDISFSRFFWNQVLNGGSLREAFLQGKKAIAYVTQHLPNGAITAQIDDDGDGVSNEKIDGYASRYITLGTGIMLAGDDPVIGSVSEPMLLNGSSSSSIWAKDVTTTDTINKVWAVITPQSSVSSGDTPILNLPEVELFWNETSGRYDVVYNGFSAFGTYGISIFAKDTKGNISLPALTSVDVVIGNVTGDINGDGTIDLTDIMIALKLLSGEDVSGLIRSEYSTSGCDVNGNSQIGIEEAIYILQHASNMR